MSLYFFAPEECEKHEMGANHPESPDRLKAIKKALIRDNLWQQLTHKTAELASPEILALGHDSNYIKKVFKNSPYTGYYALDPDTQMNPHSLRAAQLATGAAIQSIDAIFSESQEITQAFCSIRPPGHHAEYAKAMGFCFFNSVAIAANYAKQHYHLSRIAIVDFDVHHGNGTENIIANDNSINLISTFQWPLYPGSGIPSSAKNIHNFSLDAGDGSKQVRQLWHEQISPLLHQIKPELLVISAGFDAHKDDPLAQLRFEDDDYAFFARQLKQVATTYSKGRLLACLEGGYNLDALGNSVSKFINALLD